MQLSSERSLRCILSSANSFADVNVTPWIPVDWYPSLTHNLCPGQQEVNCDGSRILGHRLLCLNTASHQPCPTPSPTPPTQTLPHSLWVCPLGYQILSLMCSKSFALTSHCKKISRGKNLKNFFLLDALGVFPDLGWNHLEEVPKSASHQGSTGVDTSSVVSGFPPGEGELSWGKCEVHFHISPFKLRITDLCP